MTCPDCKHEVERLIHCTVRKDFICRQCYYSDKSESSSKLNFVLYGNNGKGINSKGNRTAAHDADISRRKISPQGEVYRDYGRRYFGI